MNNGCYAEMHYTGMHWRKLDEGKRPGIDAATLFEKIRSMPKGQLFRMNEAGDLPHIDQCINAEFMHGITQANKGRNGFTYTHHRVTGTDNAARNNRHQVRAANQQGFTVNLSADNPEQADILSALNIGPVVCLLDDSVQNRVQQTPEGRPIVICPNVTIGISCAVCGLCANPDRKSIVGFPVHGISKGAARKVFALKVISNPKGERVQA